jgi:hypothetical protein
MLDLKNTSAYRHPHSNRPDRSDLGFGPQVVNKIGHEKEELAFGRDYSRPPCVRDNSNTISACYYVHAILPVKCPPPSFYSLFYCPEFAIVSEDLCLCGSGHLCFSFFYKLSSYPSTTTLIVHLPPYLRFSPHHYDCWPAASHLIPILRRTHVCAPLANQKVSTSHTDKMQQQTDMAIDYSTCPSKQSVPARSSTSSKPQAPKRKCQTAAR